MQTMQRRWIDVAWKRAVGVLLLPAVPIVLLGVVLVQQGRVWATDTANRSATDAAVLVSDMAIGPLFTAEDFGSGPLTGPRLDEVKAVLWRLMEDRVVQVTIWHADGRVIYRSDSDGGDDVEISSELEMALAGTVATSVSDLDEPKRLSGSEFSQVFEVSVPLRLEPGGGVVGAFEIHLPYTPLDDAISRDTRHTAVVLAIALVFLYVALLRLTTDWARARVRAATKEHEANHDSLTGLPNHRFFHERLNELIARERPETFALFFLDVDGFKAINDEHGHVAGDHVLQLVSERLSGAIRSGAFVARVGGDEFAIIVPRIATGAAARNVVARLTEHLSSPFNVDGVDIRVHVSIGFDIASGGDVDADELQSNADKAMYKNRRRRR